MATTSSWFATPDDEPAPRIDAANSSFGRGGNVIYQAAPRSEIPPMQWTREGEQTSLTTESLERGVILTTDNGELVRHSYSYYDVNEQDSSSAALEARGYQAGGYSWAGIVHGLVALGAPHFVDDIELDPEGDGLAVHSSRRDALVAVAELVAAAKKDAALLDAAIERAVRDGVME